MSVTSTFSRTATRRAANPALYGAGGADDDRRERSSNDRETRRFDTLSLEPHWIAAIEAATD
jgi:hypothetical protein